MLCLVTALCWPVAAEQGPRVTASARQGRALASPVLQAEVPRDPPRSQSSSPANAPAGPGPLPPAAAQTRARACRQCSAPPLGARRTRSDLTLLDSQLRKAGLPGAASLCAWATRQQVPEAEAVCS